MLLKIIVKLMGGIWRLKEKCNQTSNTRFRSLYITIYDRYLANMGSYIGYTTELKGFPIFPHSILGIFISGQAQIGKNCVIFQHVTIGSNTLPDSKSKGAPIIGNNCYIGVGAKIIGNVRVGNNVRIGANCVVVKDIPDNCTVVLQPPNIINSNIILNNKYYSRRSDGWAYYCDDQWIIEQDEDVLVKLSN